MAQIVGNQVKKNDGSLITPKQGEWYDGQQYWGGTLSNAGQINSLSNQQGAGQQVSKEVVAQTNPNNVSYLQQQGAQLPSASSTTPQNPGATVPGTGTGTGTGIPGGGIQAPAALDLQSMYKNLYDSNGISDLEKKASDSEKAFNDAQSKINDNPFLSEATRVGRIQKLQGDYNNNTANLKNDIATKKADIETQLNIATKQFDINSQSAQQALSQFNTLLGMGALDNASGDDIANITRSTGLSSSAIQSAIKANQDKNVQTSVMQYDDGTNQGFAVINTKTGAIISKTSVAASKPAASSGKLSQPEQKAYYTSTLASDAKSGVKLKDLFSIYSGIIDPNDIYTIYNSNSKYGVDKNSEAVPGTGYLSNYGVTLFK